MFKPTCSLLRGLACLLLALLAAGCGQQGAELTTTDAETKLREALALAPLTWVYQEHLTQEELSRNPGLHRQLDRMRDKGLLELVPSGEEWEARLTGKGQPFRLAHDPSRHLAKGEVLVRAATKELMRVDSISEIKTNRGGSTYRDIVFTWQYGEVTPFGEVLGVKPKEPKQTQTVAVLYGDGWRFSLE